MRVDEGTKGPKSSRGKNKGVYRSGEGGRGEKRMRSDPGSEFRLGLEKEKEKVRR